jgi:O-antigen/teichoic acid export membrane protein
MSNKKLFIKNSFSGVFQKIIVAILLFFAIPFFISKLGVISYGIFATVSVIGDLSRIANIGFHIALIKYLSVQGKTKESSIDIVVAFISMLIIIVPISALMIIFSNFVLVDIFKIAPSDIAQSKALYVYLVLANMFLFLGLTFSAMLESQKKIYLNNTLQLVYSILYWTLMIVALWFGKGLESIGLMAFASALIWFILIAYYAFKEWGKLSIRGINKLYWNSVKKQLGYGLQIYTSGLMGLFGEPLLKVMVANFFGPTYVGFLDIGMRIRNQIARIFQAALWPLFQLFSEMKDKEGKARIVKDIQEKTVLVILPICFLILFGAKPLVTLWIGNNIDIISLNIIYVTVGSLIGFLSFQAMNNLMGVDHPMMLLVNSTIINIPYFLVIYLFHNILGYNAVFLSLVGAYVFNLAFLAYYQKKYMGSVSFGSRSQIIGLIIFLVIMLVSGWAITLVIAQPIILLVALSIIIPILTVVLYVYLSLITEQDIEKYLGKKIFAKPFNYIFALNNRIKGINTGK